MNIQFVAADPAGVQLTDFDPFGMDFRRDPTAFHQRLFENSPGFMLMEAGVPSAFVAKYRQVQDVLKNFRAFSSTKPQGLPGMQRIDFFNSLPVMNYSDPPDHIRRRKVVNGAFAPERTKVLIEAALSEVDKVLDRLIPGREFEVISQFAKPVAYTTLLTHFMQLDHQDQAIFIEYIGTLSLLDKLKMGDPKPQPYLDAWERGREFCRRQKELAREGKCSNLIGLIANSADGGTLSDDEMMAMMIVLLTGGAGTVSGALGAVTRNLAKYPHVAARIRKEPELAPAFHEETLRLDPPVSLVMRFAADDTQIGDVVIPKGMPVYVMIATACHDPDIYTDPSAFDIDRPNIRDHLAFGYGMHTCIGSNITRNIVPAIIARIAERMPNLHLVGSEGGLAWDLSTPRARHVGKLTVAV
jgi:cytochrome P450